MEVPGIELVPSWLVLLIPGDFGNLTCPPPTPLLKQANTLVSLFQQLIKATVFAENSFIFSLDSLSYADVYRHR